MKSLYRRNRKSSQEWVRKCSKQGEALPQPRANVADPILDTENTMPPAIALLQEPLVAYALLVGAAAALLRAVYVPQLLPGFAGIAAGLLALLAYLPQTPSPRGFVLLALGLALLNAEFRFSTYGSAGTLGLAASFYGSWSLLQHSAGPGRWFPSVAAAALGTLALLATVVHGWRRRTLPPA